MTASLLLAVLLALAGPARADPALDAILPPDGTTSAPAGVPQGNGGDDPFAAVRQDILDQFHPNVREYVDVGDMTDEELIAYVENGALPGRFGEIAEVSESLWDAEPDPSGTPQPDTTPTSPQPDRLDDAVSSQPGTQPPGSQPPTADTPIRGRPVQAPQAAAGRPGGNEGAAKADAASRKAPTPRTEEENRERQERQADAQRNARDLADKLKKSLKEPGELDGGKEDSLKGPTGRDGLPDLDPGRKDLLLASVSPGFASVFREMGLKPKMERGRLGFARADGSAASPAEIDALTRQIRGLPLALTRHPDLFRHVSPAEFRDLQQAYHDRPALRDSAFRDVDLTEGDRDFVWSESCDKVSGECNENAGDSYQKGKYVPPKDLKAILASIPEPTEEEKALIAQMAGAGGKLSGGGLFKGGLRGLLSRLFSGSPAAGDDAAVALEEGEADGMDDAMGRAAWRAALSEGPDGRAAPDAPVRQAGFPPHSDASVPRRLLLSTLPGAAMLIGWLLWRRRGRERDPGAGFR